MSKEVKKENTNQAGAKTVTQNVPEGPQQVTNFHQAISVLLQAAEIGRKAAIYDWEDSILIGQAVILLTDAQQQAQEQAVAQQQKQETPVPETKEVNLEPIKD